MISSKVLPFNRDGGGPGTVVDAGVGEAPVAGAAVEVEAPAVAPAGVADVPAVALHGESADGYKRFKVLTHQRAWQAPQAFALRRERTYWVQQMGH